MIVLGLILIILGFGTAVVVFLMTQSSTTTVEMTALGFTSSMTPVAIFFTGVGAGLAVWFGWSALKFGLRSAARKRRHAKELMQEAREARDAKKREAEAAAKADAEAARHADYSDGAEHDAATAD